MNTRGKVAVQNWESKGATKEKLGDETQELDRALPPQAELVSNSGGIEEQSAIGQDLGTLLRDNDVHPVLIFGSKGSGKTSLLASLLAYMQKAEAEASLTLLESIFPPEDPRWVRHIAWARDLFYKKIIEWHDGKAPRSTLEETPFFIPVTVTKTTGEEAKFAFLEGKGEWYQPDLESDVPFRPFHALLRGMLQQYNGPASVIFVAPFVTGSYAKNGIPESPQSTGMINSDLGLVGAIDEYANLRRALLHYDRQMFLMTKWDIYCGGISGDSFSFPAPNELEDVFHTRFERAWARFLNVKVAGSEQNKRYSAYCSGVIDEQSVLKPAQEDIGEVSKFPRKLWDWLYQNRNGSILYPDIQPKPEGLLDRLIRFLRG